MPKIDKVRKPKRLRLNLSEKEIEDLPEYEKNIYKTRIEIMEIQRSFRKPNLNNHARALSVSSYNILSNRTEKSEARLK